MKGWVVRRSIINCESEDLAEEKTGEKESRGEEEGERFGLGGFPRE